MKTLLLLVILFITSVCSCQTPKPQFNHCLLVLDSFDYSALINSEFILNEFSGFSTKKSSTGSMTWTGAYMFGDINYIEIFAPSSSEHQTGSSAFALSTDHIGDIMNIQKILSDDYLSKIELKERKFSDTLIPWFKALYLTDSFFNYKSDIGFWIMEYEKEYFSYNNFKTTNDSVTRLQYLKQYDQNRENKYLKRFTEIVFYANEIEFSYYSKLLLKCGFIKSGDKTFITSEGFKFSFEPINQNSKYSIKSIRFDTNKTTFQKISISNHVQIIFHGKEGQIVFN